MRLPRSLQIFLILFVCVFAGFRVFHTGAHAEPSTFAPNSPNGIFFQGKPSLTHFTSTDGLPVNAVMSLERDDRGFIWFGTQDGAAVFNGHNFSVVDMPNRAVSNYIYDILAARDGSIWFATSNGGVHRLKDGEWKTFDVSAGLATNETRSLFESFTDDGRQVIWIGRRSGLSKLVDDKIENFDGADGLPDERVRCVIETTDKAGIRTLWIGTYGGIAVWRGDEKKVYGTTDGLPGETVFSLLEAVNQDGESEIWAGTDKGLAVLRNGVWNTFADVSDVFTKTVRSLGRTAKADGTQTIWVGFDTDGVAYFENDRWFFLDKNRGLPDNLIFGFAPSGAPDGSVWISILGNGVIRFERSNWRKFTTDNGLSNNIVFSMHETVSTAGEKVFWFGTYGGGLVRMAPDGRTVFNQDNGILNDFVQSMLSTRNEQGEEILYVGTEKGLLGFQNGNWKEIDLKQEQELLEIWNIRESTGETGEKSLWISASVGLIKKTGERIETFGSKNGLPDDRVRATLETISKDGKKTLWVATYNGGLARLRDGRWSVFDEKSGLPTNRVYTVAEIKYADRRQLWVGLGGGGIAIMDLDNPRDEFRIVNTENSPLLPSDTVYQILQDGRNRIYATTNKGVARINPGGSENVLDFPAYFFTTDDGLPNNECIAGASFKDSDGRIWVGTVGGAAVLDLSREFNDEKAEPLFLQSVLIGGEKKSLEPNTKLSYDQNNLTFEYVMPTNFRESATVYQTQMIGLEDKPTDWTKEPRREFTFLPSGDFTFKVWGKDASGNISEPLVIPFTIRPAWWVTWWAIFLYFLTTAAAVSFIAYLVYRNRYRRMLEIERVRTRIATDLHDDVGSSLSKISILSEVLAQNQNGMKSDDRDALKMIADTSREVVGSMSDMVWSINPNRDNFRDTVQRMRRFASEVLSAKDIEFTFDAPKDLNENRLDVDLRRQIYLVFKESLNNAVKHSGCTKVAIELKRRADGIYLTVADNGKGFDRGDLSEGNGLINMRKRAEEIGGKLEISSTPGAGTTVTLKLPRRLGGFAVPKTT
jgi:ligand-binding sensor domain-containing protein/two-component sensor histidine kinase